MTQKTLQRFNGLNNVDDPMRGTGTGTKEAQSWEWLSVADNVDLTDSGGVARREGYRPFAPGVAITSAFSTFDFARLFIIDGDTLLRVYADGSTQPLFVGLSGVASWAEINDGVYLSCGAAKLQIETDNVVRPWGIPTPAQPNISLAGGSLDPGTYQAVLTYTDDAGREGGACMAVEITLLAVGGFTMLDIPQVAGYTAQLYVTEADGTVFYLAASLPNQTAYTVTQPAQGMELLTQFYAPPPADGELIAFYGARAYVAHYVPEWDKTVIWFSQPLGFHLFAIDRDYFMVPGAATQLYGAADALIVSTENRIFLYAEGNLKQVADYGALPGNHACHDTDGKTYFWTQQGLCRASPFENLTESRVSVAPGLQAGGGIIERGGFKKYVAVIHQGGTPYNARTS